MEFCGHNFQYLAKKFRNMEEQQHPTKQYPTTGKRKVSPDEKPLIPEEQLLELRQSYKELLKRNHLKRADLSPMIGSSLSTINKKASTQDFTLKEMVAIANASGKKFVFDFVDGIVARGTFSEYEEKIYLLEKERKDLLQFIAQLRQEIATLKKNHK